MVKIELQNVSFQRDGIPILSNTSLTIQDGEYLIIVGPTGAGKTSLVGLISGLYSPSSGKILFDDKDVTNLPPNERHCGVMFESYALFPHLNVIDNVSYARHMHENNHIENYSVAEAVLELVRLSNRENALPAECSGGMQQRVALARSIMALEEGGILILDEPFKALDAGLRLNLRREVRNIAKSSQLHLTTIHVTNDMQEAMLADRIVVLDQGGVRQIGTPTEIMYGPIDLFVANFFSTELNWFNGTVLSVDPAEFSHLKQQNVNKTVIQTLGGFIFYAKTEKQFNPGDAVTFLIRSQYFNARHKRRDDKTNSVIGKVKRVKFMGAWLRIELEVRKKYEDLPDSIRPNSMREYTEMHVLEPPSRLLKIEVPTTRVATHNFRPGETMTAYFPSQYVIVFPQISEADLNAMLRVK